MINISKIFLQCPLCFRVFRINDMVIHHVSYVPPITMRVCVRCHNRIHHSKDPKYAMFRDADSVRKLDFEEFVGLFGMPICVHCGKRIEVEDCAIVYQFDGILFYHRKCLYECMR